MTVRPGRFARAIALTSSLATCADAIEESGAFHNFPALYDDAILAAGSRTVVNEGYTLYQLPGSVNGVTGMYRIGTRPTALGGGEPITHRFFRPGA